MSWFYYYKGQVLEAFTSTSGATAKSFMKRRYGADTTGAIVKVGSSRSKEGIAYSETANDLKVFE